MSRIIDLTLPLKPGMRGVEIEPAKVLAKDGWNATRLHLYSHCGTHMDAPVHFGVRDQTIDEIPLGRCMGPAWVVDLTGIPARALIELEDLGDVVDELQAGDSLLLRTGWSEYVSRPEYLDAMPRVSMELGCWCADEGVAMLGMETPAVADVNNVEEITAVHRVLFEGDVIIVEGLTNLDSITKEKVTFMAFPLRVSGGDGSPVRAFAVEEG
ncbi:MAG: cyclase family protein [Phycisphaerales bacterium]|nr:MAG: cyclase family protein [Phycisphaerales bacterium]